MDGVFVAEVQIGLPIEIITGAECSVRDPNEDMGDDEVHLLCLGLDNLPRYNSRTLLRR